MKKTLSLLLSLVFVVSLLAGCGNPGTTTATPTPDANPETSGTPAPEGTPAPSAGGPFEITLNIASEPQSIDPALNSAVDGAIMLGHMFEGLMKWKDSGVETPGSDGTCTNAELTEGQAESYEKVVNDDGTVTYTFKIRSDARWSDGKPVTAGDFVYSWQRLVTPETAADYNYMIDSVVNANEIMAGDMDPTELAVSAPDDSTFVVTLTSDLPYFLEVCAFPATFPVRQDVTTKEDGTPNDQWTFDVATYLCNGPYKLTAWNHNSEIVMEPNEQYYDVANLGPDKITFKLMDDQNAMLSGFNSGELDFIEDVPQAELPSLIASGDLKIVDYIGTYYVCYQTQKAPFDDPRVRQAFTLAVNRTFIVDQVTQAGQVPANGFVPAGVYDAAGSTGDDFRTVGGAYYSIEGDADYSYEANCEKARELLADAGYPNGEGFPVVEYLYNTSDAHKAMAEALQNMWETELGVKVTLNNQEWAVFLQTRKDGNYSIARNGWIADYNDPMSFLDMWLTGGGNNDAQYSNPEYDALIDAAKATSVPKERMEAFHKAEDILIKDDAVLAPVYFYTQPYMLADDIEGMYYTPLGYFFFGYTSKK